MLSPRYLAIMLKIFLRRSMLPIFLLVAWFVAGFAIHSIVYGLGLRTALMYTFYIGENSSSFSYFYGEWGSNVILGIAFAIIFQNILEKYNPSEGCRMLSKEMENHYIIIGYTHLGERLVDHMLSKGLPFVLIEKDCEKVDHLLKAGNPVIVDDPMEKDVLPDANVAKAKAVIITIDNVEASMVLTKRIRDVNKTCLLVVRNFHDELTEVFESLGASEIISGSKSAMEQIISKIGQ